MENLKICVDDELTKRNVPVYISNFISQIEDAPRFEFVSFVNSDVVFAGRSEDISNMRFFNSSKFAISFGERESAWSDVHFSYKLSDRDIGIFCAALILTSLYCEKTFDSVKELLGQFYSFNHEWTAHADLKWPEEKTYKSMLFMIKKLCEYAYKD